MMLTILLLTAFTQTAFAEPLLKLGSAGQDVTKAQQRLIQWGYMSGAADGVYGYQTQAAVVAFQRKSGLTADGILGKGTAKAMGITLSGEVGIGYISGDHRLLARVVYAEARGESYQGQVAVAAVALNRVRFAGFPNTLYGVVFQKNAFTCVNDGQINLTPNETAMRAALEALLGADPTDGCTYYYNPETFVDQWITTRTIMLQIGRHVFAM